VTDPDVRPFRVQVEEAQLTDLRDRLRRTCWPDPAPGPAWSQGTDDSFLRRVVAHWADGFDWPAAEHRLNEHAHFLIEIGGVDIHFVHVRGGGLPLLLTHGWPSSFAELLPLVPRLPGFDLVIPSLPGYCFSGRQPGRHTLQETAGLWHQLMHRLGYDRYGAVGSDFGSAVSTYLALDHPESVVGLYLSDVELDPGAGSGSPPLSAAEKAYLAAAEDWEPAEGAYHAVAATKPQTLAYGLQDSPAALAAWVLEKWRAWADSGGEPDVRPGLNLLLTTTTLWWVTGTAARSLRDYHDNLGLGPALGRRVIVPTAVGVFGHGLLDATPPPREWAERLYDVCRWTVHPRGGHFPAAEVPDLLAADLTAFFADLY